MVRQNEIAEESSYRDLRAYFSLNQAYIDVFDDSNNPGFLCVRVYISLKNEGRTPAIIKRSIFYALFSIGRGGAHIEGRDNNLDIIISPNAIHTEYMAFPGFRPNAPSGVWQAAIWVDYDDFRGNPLEETLMIESDIINNEIGRYEMKISRHVYGNAIPPETRPKEPWGRAGENA